ncbi:MAG: hypothetical protein ACRC68_06750, partial [Clostridium sp.]
MNTTTYMVISSYTIISSSPSILCNILGYAIKGTKVAVISTSDDWALVYYNGNNAYIRLFTLQIVPTITKGSVKIRYIDEATSLDIFPSSYYSNIDFGIYSYASNIIKGYSLIGNNTQTIELTNTNYNLILTFSYKKTLGSVTIYYIDKIAQMEIIFPTIMSNIELGNYTYNPIFLQDYNIIDSSSQSIILTEENSNIAIAF